MKIIHALLVATALLGGCKKGDAGGDGKAAQAKELLSAYTKPGADPAALTNALRPKAGDYEAAFVGDAATKLKAGMDPLWDSGKLILKPTADQTEVIVAGAGQGDLASGTGNAQVCPASYKDIAAKIQPKMAVFCARFLKPGEKHGLSVDGLMFVNGHWALFPKPWRILGDKPVPGAATGAPTGAAPAPTGAAPAP